MAVHDIIFIAYLLWAGEITYGQARAALHGDENLLEQVEQAKKDQAWDTRTNLWTRRVR